MHQHDWDKYANISMDKTTIGHGILREIFRRTKQQSNDWTRDLDNWFVPISVFYMCTGLAISTIALDIGSIYVRKLHFIGKKIKNIANIRIWFGARNLEVRELITAVGQNIGIDQNVIADIDIDTLVKTAIQVKLGRLSRVPQTHMIVEEFGRLNWCRRTISAVRRFGR
ncbi:unnamed protein product [Caenorhabditis angaria]|uniref:Uncharacterized protein n=1 Tax=Caenorhabditis angaria TaxID=860376 RepID=A0A9P1I638_9PELO|nr:unnamed protein product [Caenorhabditis angaria]